MKKNIVVYFTTIFLLLSINCHSQKNDELIYDSLMQKDFSIKDIRNFNKILSFFDKMVQQDCYNNNIVICYEQFFEKIKTYQDPELLSKIINIKKQNYLLAKIDNSTFNKIWYISNKKAKTIAIKPKSPYINFLIDMGNNKKYIKDYYEPIVETGDITPGLMHSIMLYYNNFNIEDKKERLILVIHYLTLNSRNK